MNNTFNYDERVRLMKEEFNKKKNENRGKYDKAIRRMRLQFIVTIILVASWLVWFSFRLLPYVTELFEAVINFLNK